jgi:hypothetical protein
MRSYCGRPIARREVPAAARRALICAGKEFVMNQQPVKVRDPATRVIAITLVVAALATGTYFAYRAILPSLNRARHQQRLAEDREASGVPADGFKADARRRVERMLNDWVQSHKTVLERAEDLHGTNLYPAPSSMLKIHSRKTLKAFTLSEGLEKPGNSCEIRAKLVLADGTKESDTHVTYVASLLGTEWTILAR